MAAFKFMIYGALTACIICLQLFCTCVAIVYPPINDYIKFSAETIQIKMPNYATRFYEYCRKLYNAAEESADRKIEGIFGEAFRDVVDA